MMATTYSAECYVSCRAPISVKISQNEAGFGA